MDGSVHMVSHPVVQHKLTLLRRSETTPVEFRVLMRDVSALLLCEARRDLPSRDVQIKTPLVQVAARRSKAPAGFAACDVFVVDPMLAAGHSAVTAIGRIKELSVRRIKLISLLAAPEGVALMRAEHPDAPIYTGSVDSKLDEHAYIAPA